MIRLKSLTLILAVVSTCAWSFEDTLKSEEPHNLILKEKDAESGVYDTSYDTSSDLHRLSGIYRTNLNLKKMDGLSSFEIGYSYKMNLFWSELFVQKTSGRFECLATNNENISASSTDLEQTKSDLITLGAGLSLRSTIIQDLLGEIVNAERLFESTAAALTYNRFTDNYRSETFTGPGLRAEYGIHYRATPGFHVGPRFSYNLATVKRPKETDDQNSSKRSLVLSWATLGLDLSFYF